MSQAIKVKRKSVPRTKSRMGGWRPGAGSKPTIGATAARPITVYFAPEQLAAIDRWCNLNGRNRSEAVRHFVSTMLV